MSHAMTDPVITMTVKEAEALEAEMAALADANTKLSTELATAKTATDKSPAAEKAAEAMVALMGERRLISQDKVAETKANLLKEGGIVAYFKKALDLYADAQGARKEAEAKLKEVPAHRLGRTVETEKKAGEGEKPANALQAASNKFAQRVLAAR